MTLWPEFIPCYLRGWLLTLREEERRGGTDLDLNLMAGHHDSTILTVAFCS